MNIIINIPTELYEECKHTELSERIEGFPFHIIKLVANGTPITEDKIGGDSYGDCLLCKYR